MATIKCPAANSFCDETTNSCRSERPLSCTASAFTCTGTGTYPDPDNCKTYYICTAAGAEAFLMSCPTGYAFDSINKNCKKAPLAKDCATIKCTASAFVVYPADKSYYAYCNADLRPLVFQCPQGEQFDVLTSGCKFVCSAEGYFAGPENTSFYLCFKSGTTMSFIKQFCPTGLVYDAIKTNCVTPL